MTTTVTKIDAAKLFFFQAGIDLKKRSHAAEHFKSTAVHAEPWKGSPLVDTDTETPTCTLIQNSDKMAFECESGTETPSRAADYASAQGLCSSWPDKNKATQMTIVHWALGWCTRSLGYLNLSLASV